MREGVNEVDIHTIDCRTLAQYEDQGDRWRDLAWTPEAERNTSSRARLRVTILNTPGVLGEVCTIIGEAGGNIVGLKMTHRQEDVFDVDVDLDVTDNRHITTLIAALRACPSVEGAERPMG
jgi:GTP pyrophosphokinase/guanosine-3',5'-bis(diphosphate) 3'-pyrophosphohydrolase